MNFNFCGYAEGVFSYVREVIARTEKYWCPIKHSKRSMTRHYRDECFTDFGDADALKNRLGSLRQNWSDLNEK